MKQCKSGLAFLLAFLMMASLFLNPLSVAGVGTASFENAPIVDAGDKAKAATEATSEGTTPEDFRIVRYSDGVGIIQKQLTARRWCTLSTVHSKIASV